MAGLPKLRAKGVELNLFQGDETWQTFFDHGLVDLSDNERQELLDRADSEGRREREEKDMELWEEHVLETPNGVGDLQQSLENLVLPGKEE